MLQLNNPIPASCNDVGKLQSFWNTFYKEKRLIMPYYGDSESTSHTFLKLLSDLTSRSPSYKAIERTLNRFCFSSKVDVVKSPLPGIAGKIKKQKRKKREAFYFFWKDLGLPVSEIPKISAILESHKKQCGNAWLRVKRIQVGEVKQVFFEVVHYKTVAYLATQTNEDKIAIIMPDWDDEYLTKTEKKTVKPVLINVSDPQKELIWTQRGEELEETLIHYKTEGNDESDWYGRPDIIACLEWLYAEIALGDLSCKVNSTEVVTKTIFLFEAEDDNSDEGGDEDKDDSFTRAIHTLKKITTNQGHRQQVSGIGAIEYPKDNKEPKVINISVNRDTAWFKENIEKSAGFIASVLGWSPQLTGVTNTSGGISSNILTDMFLIRNTETVEPCQEFWENNWNHLLGELAIWAEDSKMSQYGIQFQDKVTSLVETIAATKKNPKNEDTTKSE